MNHISKFVIDVIDFFYCYHIRQKNCENRRNIDIRKVLDSSIVDSNIALGEYLTSNTVLK